MRNNELKPVKTNGCTVQKGWGHELIIENNDLYCGKLLVFRKGLKSSMHYHVFKDETWYVAGGQFTFRWIDPETGRTNEEVLVSGDVVRIRQGLPHQLEALLDGTIFEVSSQHFDNDSYRVYKGD